VTYRSPDTTHGSLAAGHSGGNRAGTPYSTRLARTPIFALDDRFRCSGDDILIDPSRVMEDDATAADANTGALA